ncbi:MAG: hypothetical protein V3T86_02860 [Planctomycetota bacterium]
MRRFEVTVLLLAVAVTIAAPFTRRDTERCTLDGVDVQADFRVRIIDERGTDLAFCGVRCAGRWIERSKTRPHEIHVTDVTNGEELLASEATFVHDIQGWTESVPDFIRVFADESEATRHASTFGGELLRGADVPLSFSLSGEAPTHP